MQQGYWFFFALLAGMGSALSSLFSRRVLRVHTDGWAFSVLYSTVGAIVSFPFVLRQQSFPQDPRLWALLVFVCMLIVLQNYLAFSATQTLPASVQGSLTKLRLMWILLFGWCFLGESLGVFKLVGTVLTLLAGLVVTYHPRKMDLPSSGVLFAIAATLIYSIVIILYKPLLTGFSVPVLTFAIFLLPACLNGVMMPHCLSRVTTLFQKAPKQILLATVLGGGVNLAMNQALALGEVSRVSVLMEASLIIVFVGEIVWLKEKSDLIKKGVATALATLGAILIRAV